MPPAAFKKYFTLAEAARVLPDIASDLKQAQKELAVLSDGAIFTQRLLQAKQDSNRDVSDAELELLQEKFETFESALERWLQYFEDQGILLRDLESGLIDFPYHSQSRQEDFFLCWRPDEDGIFYFHGIREGFAGRHPISLLPE